MELVYFLIGTLLFYLFSSMLFGALNASVLKLFIPFQKRTGTLKRKKGYYIAAKISMIFILVYIVEAIPVTTITSGAIFGVLMALVDIIFGKSIISSKPPKTAI